MKNLNLIQSTLIISSVVFAVSCAESDKTMSESIQPESGDSFDSANYHGLDDHPAGNDSSATDSVYFPSEIPTGESYAELQSDSPIVDVVEEAPGPDGMEPELQANASAEGNNAPTPEAKDAPKTLAAAQGVTRSQVQCSLSNDKRSVSVVDKTEGGCGVNYLKFGEERQVAWANFDMSYCDKVSDKIQGNLATAGFSCSGDIPELASDESNNPEEGATH